MVILLAVGLVGVAAWCMRGGLRRAALLPRRPTRSGVSFDSVGFTVTGISPHSTENARVSWTEVRRVAAYRSDLWCDTVVCLWIERSSGTGIELNEEMAGWEPFCETLPRFLPDYSPMPELLGQIPAAPATIEFYVHAAA